MNQPAQKIDGWLVDENGAGCIGDMDRAIHVEDDSLVIETVGATSDDLTPSEVALAKILAAWEEWRVVGDCSHLGGQGMIAIETTLIALGYVASERQGMGLTAPGVALLGRARKAGML